MLSYLLILAALMVVWAVALTYWKDVTYRHSQPYTREAEGPADVLVVYFSRSGHTENMAREIARTFQADIRHLEAQAYSLDLRGWKNAARDAQYHTESPISPATIDMTPYRLIFIGSPIWLFRPAPPLWTFVRNTDFQGKPVVLFNTFNSRFKPDYLAEFQALIEASHGRYLDHIYVRRGRIYWQKSSQAVLRETRELLDKREELWEGVGG